ncbi:MAG: hypothetical protein U0R17_03010 [Acidimicrobiia bacterium]
MINQINSEWIKLKSVRSNIVMLLFAIGITLFFATVISIFSEGQQNISNALIGLAISQTLFVVTGVQMIGQEYRFGTIKTTFSATPNRLKVAVSKIIVLILSTGIASLILTVLSLGIAKLILNIRDIPLDLTSSTSLRIMIFAILGSAAGAIYGYGIGAIVKQPVAGIIISLIWMIIVENVISGVTSLISKQKIHLDRWLFFTNYNSSISEKKFPGYFSPTISFLYFLGFCIVLSIIGTIFVYKRDA